MRAPSLLTIAVLSLMSLPVAADITVEDAWARATPPAARTAALYLTLVNDGAGDALVGAETDAADFAELHTHVHEDGMMAMKQVKAIEVPAGGRAELKPHGDHLMLISLRKDLVPGETVKLTLQFEKAEPVTVEVPVRDARRP